MSNPKILLCKRDPLKENKILALSKLKAVVHNKLKFTQNIEFVLNWVENIMGKKRKCWLQARSPFPTIFLKGFFLKIVKGCHYVVKGKPINNLQN